MANEPYTVHIIYDKPNLKFVQTFQNSQLFNVVQKIPKSWNAKELKRKGMNWWTFQKGEELQDVMFRHHPEKDLFMGNFGYFKRSNRGYPGHT